MQEYRQVATRPQASNGLGLSSAEAAAKMNRLETEFTLVPENPSIYTIWRQIVEASEAIGRANFDARLVAVAKLAGIQAVLSYEAGSFAKYAATVSGVSILHPQDL
jgi:predicted nucleic acid-binding protein